MYKFSRPTILYGKTGHIICRINLAIKYKIFFLPVLFSYQLYSFDVGSFSDDINKCLYRLIEAHFRCIEKYSVVSLFKGAAARFLSLWSRSFISAKIVL